MGNLCTTISGLWTGKKPPFINVAVIRNTNFSKEFTLNLDNVAYLDVEVKQFEKRKLQAGDLIVEKSGGSENQPVGRTILFNINDGNYSFSNFTSLLRINNKEIILPTYLQLFLRSIYNKGLTRNMQKRTTGIHNLDFKQFLNIQIILPPIAEQERIVNYTYELLSKINILTETL